MNIKFSLNNSQIKIVKKHGLVPIVCGPVEGTKDMYFLEVEQTKTASLIKAVLRWGKEQGILQGREEGFKMGKEIGFKEGTEVGLKIRLAKVITMNQSTRKLRPDERKDTYK